MYNVVDEQDTPFVLTNADKLAFPLNLPFILTFFYQHLFHNPSSIPRHWLIDHKIHLVPNIKIINVRPPSLHSLSKSQDGKINQGDAWLRHIRPSQSLFSLPVLLLKNKDDFYCFCVDYRMINVVTIKDKFFIPAIDELLDELVLSVSWFYERVIIKYEFLTGIFIKQPSRFMMDISSSLSCLLDSLMPHQLFKIQWIDFLLLPT